jgi:hypothetical protein
MKGWAWHISVGTLENAMPICSFFFQWYKTRKKESKLLHLPYIFDQNESASIKHIAMDGAWTELMLVGY